MMTSIAIGLGWWFLASVVAAIVFSVAKGAAQYERDLEICRVCDERLAREFDAAWAQRREMEAALGIPEVTNAQIAVAFSDIHKDYDAPISRDEAERMQRLLAFGQVAPVMARAFMHPAPVAVSA